MIGQKTYNDYSVKTVKSKPNLNPTSSQKILLKRYKNIIKIIQKEIGNGITPVRVKYFDNQGYVPPMFKIRNYNFLESMCFDEEGKSYKCQVYTNVKDNRGRPPLFPFLPEMIDKIVKQKHLNKGVTKVSLSADAIIADVNAEVDRQNSMGQNLAMPSDSIIRIRLHEKYPECKKASRNSKK